MNYDVNKIAYRLANWCETRDFAGADPYDALNSPLMSVLTLGCRYGRIFWTQALRRCPWNLRPLLLVPPGRNPKSLGLFLESYVRMAQLEPENPQWLQGIHKLLDWQQETISNGYHGNCWGYHFPWQSRVAFVPRGVPTIVNTAFVGHALLDIYEVLHIERAVEMISSAPDFILQDLHQKHEGDACCFSYTPMDENYVHNANMLGASLLARLSKVTSRPELLDPAMSSMAYSMRHQHEDGSWAYAETQQQSWIDSFHTGFNLEALRRFIQLDLAEEDWKVRFQVGKSFYREKFFLEDFTPKYYHNQEYCVDAHAPSEAIYFFSGEHDDDKAFAGHLVEWFVENMYDEKQGVFFYRKLGKRVSKIPYMRWVEAWALRGLTEYLFQQQQSTK